MSFLGVLSHRTFDCNAERKSRKQTVSGRPGHRFVSAQNLHDQCSKMRVNTCRRQTPLARSVIKVPVNERASGMRATRKPAMLLFEATPVKKRSIEPAHIRLLSLHPPPRSLRNPGARSTPSARAWSAQYLVSFATMRTYVPKIAAPRFFDMSMC